MSTILTLVSILSIFFVGKSLFRFLVAAGITFIILSLFKNLLKISAVLIVIFILLDYLS